MANAGQKDGLYVIDFTVDRSGVIHGEAHFSKLGMPNIVFVRGERPASPAMIVDRFRRRQETSR